MFSGLIDEKIYKQRMALNRRWERRLCLYAKSIFPKINTQKVRLLQVERPDAFQIHHPPQTLLRWTNDPPDRIMPVNVETIRLESYVATPKRGPFAFRMRIGCSQDASILVFYSFDVFVKPPFAKEMYTLC